MIKLYADSTPRRTRQIVADVGASHRMTVDQVSSVAGVVVSVVPILAVLAVWAVVRSRFVRRATAAQQWLAQPGALELFALRALTRQSLRRLHRVGPDPAGRFRSGDRATLRALADLELDRCALAPRSDEEWLTALPA